MTVVEGMVTVCLAGAGVGLVGIVAHVCLELKRLQAGYYSPEYWKCRSGNWYEPKSDETTLL